MNRDFAEMLGALCDQRVEFLVVGAYALAAHGLPRSTGDIDLWVRPTRENAARVWQALQAFGAPLFNLTQEDLEEPGIVFQIGLPPNRIDILTRISGVEFEEAWGNRLEIQVEGRPIPVLGRQELVKNKQASGRPKDLLDVQALEPDTQK
jgi:hypothetical protein